MEWLRKGKPKEAVLEVLRDTRVGCISTRRALPEGRLRGEMAGSGDEGGRRGAGPPRHVVSRLSVFLWGVEGVAVFFVLNQLFITRYMRPKGHGSGCAAAPRGATAGYFYKETFSDLEPACAVIVRYPSAPSPH